MAANNDPVTYVRIRAELQNINIRCGTEYRYNVKEDGTHSCYLPGLNIFYKAENFEMMQKKGQILTKFFFDFFLEKQTKYGMRNLVYELNALGYRADNHNSVMPALANNRMAKANFKAKIVKLPEAFQNSQSTFQEQQLAIAV